MFLMGTTGFHVCLDSTVLLTLRLVRKETEWGTGSSLHTLVLVLGQRHGALQMREGHSKQMQDSTSMKATDFDRLIIS